MSVDEWKMAKREREWERQRDYISNWWWFRCVRSVSCIRFIVKWKIIHMSCFIKFIIFGLLLRMPTTCTCTTRNKRFIHLSRSLDVSLFLRLHCPSPVFFVNDQNQILTSKLNQINDRFVRKKQIESINKETRQGIKQEIIISQAIESKRRKTTSKDKFSTWKIRIRTSEQHTTRFIYIYL